MLEREKRMAAKYECGAIRVAAFEGGAKGKRVWKRLSTVATKDPGAGTSARVIVKFAGAGLLRMSDQTLGWK